MPIPFLLIAVFLLGAALGAGLIVIRSRAQLAAARHLADRLTQDNAALSRLLDIDPLTRCSSRRYFVAEATKWLDAPDSAGLTLMIMDIDHFKSINDSYGHGAGDRYLAAVGKALSTHLDGRGMVARLGGDEFWIALPKADAQAGWVLAEELRERVYDIPLQTPGQLVTRSASLGVTSVPARTKLTEAMTEADTALYLAKAGGRNKALLVDATVRRQMQATKTRPTVEGIKQGLADEEFTYFVQPVFEIDSRRPVGVEALIRWVRPDGSVLLPADFMSVITANYHLSVKPPLALANEIAAAFSDAPHPMFCAFNISTSFLQRAIGKDTRWLDELLMGLPPQQMVFEIVESAVIEDAASARSLLSAMREAGVRIALDDFGTGRSNLMRLRDLPVDIVKVDRSFVASITTSAKNTAILRALVAMSGDLGYEIIAEGVETDEQLNRLWDIGITQAQGYLLGAPAPLADWREALLRPAPPALRAAE